MIKESRNLTSAAKLFAQANGYMANRANVLGKKTIARFNSMLNRNLAAAQTGRPYDQRFMDMMYPKVEHMFLNNQLSPRDFRRIYSKSKLFDTAKDTILHRNKMLRLNGVLEPRSYSRAEQREMLQYMRDLRSPTDLSKNISARREVLNDAKKTGQLVTSNYSALLDQPHQYIKAIPDTTSFAKSQGLLSREALLRQAKKEKINLNKNDLHEPFYINKGTALESSQAIPKSQWQRDVTSSVDNELKYTAANLAETEQKLQKAPRSIHRAIDIVNGQNVLHPGTRANRLFTKMQHSKSPGIKRLLSNELYLMDDAARGENAFYNTDGNFIAVNPKTPFRFRNKPIYEPASLEAHERGHFFAHNLPEAEHRAIATTLFTKLKRAAAKYNLNIPFDNPELMQEAFAEGYMALKLGKLRPFDIRLNNALYNAKSYKTNPRIYRNDIRNLKKINNETNLDDVTKQMLNQLQVSYGADIFKNWH